MPLYVLRVCMEHATFRVPSLLSVAQVSGFEIKIISEHPDRGIVVIEVDNDDNVGKLLEQGILIFTANRLLAQGDTYDALHSSLSRDRDILAPYLDKKFKFYVEATNHRVPTSRQRETINSFAQHGFTGKVDMKHPDVEFIIYEEYDFDGEAHRPGQRLRRDGSFRQVYFCIRMGDSRARPLIYAHSVKTRAYFGNTSMDAEMGFLMAAQALPAPGKIMYDPFVGTGSMLYACAHWGAHMIGSDIDGRQMRGKAKGKGVVAGVFRAAEQYGVRNNILDCMTFDITKSPWRRGGWLDAVITDPPYGVRAGAKRLGKRADRKPAQEEAYILPDGTYSHENPEYRPPSRPYELVNLTRDLVLFARWILVPKGRLVFFLPTVSEEYDAVDVPVVEGMRELKWGEGSVQDFGKWGRRLITMEKTATDDGPRPTFDDGEPVDESGGEKIPGHYQFRDRFFDKFAPRPASVDQRGNDLTTPAASTDSHLT